MAPSNLSALGLAADLREDTAARGATNGLIKPIAHPLEIVSLAALEEAWQALPKDPKLTRCSDFGIFTLSRFT